MARDAGSKKSGAGRPAPDGPVEGIILVDSALRSVAIDNGGLTILNELREPDAAESPLPGLPPQLEQPLRAVPAAELNTTTLRISADESHYTCEVFVMEPQNAMFAEPLFALYVKKERSVVEAVRRAAGYYRLTEREAETLFGIASGLTSRQIAERMKISPNTVNAFLRLIMVKMGVTTRAGVVGKLVDGKSGAGDSETVRRNAMRKPPAVSARSNIGVDWDDD